MCLAPNFIFQFCFQSAHCSVIQIQTIRWCPRLRVYTRPIERDTIRWLVNGLRNMPCDRISRMWNILENKKNDCWRMRGTKWLLEFFVRLYLNFHHHVFSDSKIDTNSCPFYSFYINKVKHQIFCNMVLRFMPLIFIKIF